MALFRDLSSKTLSCIPAEWKWRIQCFAMGPEGVLEMLRSSIRDPEWHSDSDEEFEIPYEVRPLHAICKKVGRSTGKVFKKFPEYADTLADVLPKYGKFLV